MLIEDTGNTQTHQESLITKSKYNKLTQSWKADKVGCDKLQKTKGVSGSNHLEVRGEVKGFYLCL